MQLSKKISINSILFTVSVILIAYNIIRACNLSITHDEALTYQRYITASYSDIVVGHQLTANNHILNSILAKLCISIFGDSLFAIRLPNVLAHILYLAFSVAISGKLFDNRFSALIAFLLLQFNPFLFDFWSLSRGYGIAIALVLASTYYLLDYYTSGKTKQVIISSALLCLAIYANFALLNFAVAWLVTLAAILLDKNNKKQWILSAIIATVSAAIVYVLIGRPIEILKANNELYYGGSKGFVKDTIGTLVQHSFYFETNGNIVFVISVFIALFVLLCGFYIIILHSKHGGKGSDVLLWLLLVVPAMSTVVLFYATETKYLLDRTALFLYPLFVLVLVRTLYLFNGVTRNYVRSIAFIVVLLFTANFVARINVDKTRIWAYDKHTPWLIERMIHNKKNDGLIKIYLDWMYNPSLSYYVQRNYKDQFGYLEKQNEVAYNTEDYDYYLIRKWEQDKVPPIYKLDTVFSDGTFYLYQRKQWDNNGTYEPHIQ